MLGIVYIVSAAVFLLSIFYYMDMFQQNSYRIERYWRWFKRHPLPEVFRKAKVKFTFTRRMRRLFVVELLFEGILCIISPWAALAGAVLSSFVLMLSALFLTPLERLIARWYLNDAKKKLSAHKGLIIIGITGSYGKTSTKNFLYRILSEKYNVLMTPGNFNTTMGVVRTIRERLEPFHQVLIVEMGAKQPGDIKEICALVHPSIGIVTAVGEMHLETFKTLANIQKTKFELVESLPANGYAVINAESKGIAEYENIPMHCRVDSYGIDAHRCSARAANISYTSAGMEFDFIDLDGMQHYQTHLLGDSNVLNLCAAIMVGKYLGVDTEHIKRAVLKIQPVEHRMSISRKGRLVIIDDAYNSNPQGASMALDVLHSMPVPEGAYRVVITPGFVEMGDRQYAECERLGAKAAICADVLVIVNKINREAILKGAKKSGLADGRIVCADNLALALKAASKWMTPDSIVLYENDLPDMFE